MPREKKPNQVNIAFVVDKAIHKELTQKAKDNNMSLANYLVFCGVNAKISVEVEEYNKQYQQPHSNMITAKMKPENLQAYADKINEQQYKHKETGDIEFQLIDPYIKEKPIQERESVTISQKMTADEVKHKYGKKLFHPVPKGGAKK